MDAAKIRKCWILVGGLDQQEVFATKRDTVPMERERRLKFHCYKDTVPMGRLNSVPVGRLNLVSTRWLF